MHLRTSFGHDAPLWFWLPLMLPEVYDTLYDVGDLWAIIALLQSR